MKTGAFCYCYEKKSFFKQRFIRKGLMALWFRFFLKGWIGKTGPIFLKVKVDCREVYPDGNRGRFFKGIGKDFLDGYGHWMR